MPEPDVPQPMGTIAYDRSLLDAELSDVVRYLGELLYVDMAQSYLDGRDDPRAYATEPLILPHEQHDIEVGETFPFTRTIRVLDPRFDPDFEIGEDDPPTGDTYEQIMHDLLGIKVAAAKWSWESRDMLAETIREITYPVPAIYEGDVIEPLRAAHISLQEEVSTDFGKLQHTVDNWHGTAAENFATNFYHPFGDMRASQEHLIEAIVGGTVTAKAIDESAQHSLMNAVHYVRLMLRTQLEQRQQHGNAAQEEREASMLSSVTTIAILAGGASVISAAVGSKLWAIGMEVAAAGLNIAASRIPAAAEDPLNLEGRTAAELLDTLLDSIEKIKGNARSGYEELATTLREPLGKVDILREGPDDDDGRLYPILPHIIEGVDADSFRHYPDGSGGDDR